MSATFTEGSGYSIAGNPLLGTGAYTIAQYVKITSDTNFWTSFVGCDDAGSNYNYFGTDIDGTTFRPDAGGTALSTGAAMSVGTWYYVAVTRAAGGSAHAYIAAYGGGALADTSGTRPAATNVGMTTRFGTDGYAANASIEVAYLRFWSTDLTSSELESERLSPTVVKAANLVAAYHFASASTADDSGNGNTLTALGTPGSGTSPSLSTGATVLPRVLYRGTPYAGVDRGCW